jgi:hypothetical protein
MSSAAEIQRRWNREALAAAWTELGSLSLEDVVAAGHDPAGALEVDGRFPAFQFDGDRRRVVAEVVTVLRPVLGPRAILLWVTASSGWLEGARPIDAIDRDPEAVIEAARHQAALGED